MCEYSNRIGYYITTCKNGLFSNNSAYPYIDRSGAIVTFCKVVRKLEILTFCENKMADFNLTECQKFLQNVRIFEDF